MQVEKLSNTQIRFLFTNDDLQARNINVQDMVTNASPNAGQLFQEITTYVQSDPDFFGANGSLMFEASFASDNSLSVLVTKLNPDTAGQYGNIQGMMGGIAQSFANHMPNGFNHNGQQYNAVPPQNWGNQHRHPHPQHRRPKQHRSKVAGSGYIMYAFDNFDIMAKAAAHVPSSYGGASHVCKLDGKYMLMLQNNTSHNIGKFMAQLSEFGQKQPPNPLAVSQLQEHGEVVILNGAVEKLKVYNGV